MIKSLGCELTNVSFNLSFPIYLGRLFNLSQPQFSICSKHFTNEPSKHSIKDSSHYPKTYREDLIILIVLIKWWTVFMKIKYNSEENPYCLIWMVGGEGRLRHLCQNRSCFGTKYTETSVQTRVYLNNFLNLLWHLVLNSLRVWILCLFSAPSRILA